MDTAQILSELGVTVWRLRIDGRADETVLEPASNEHPAAGSADEETVEEPVSAVSMIPAVDAFRVLSLVSEGGLLLIQPTDVRAGRRFGAELLAGATGNWGKDCTQLIFSWPQQGIENTESSMRKALGAFVEKQVADAATDRVLITRETCERVDENRLPEDALRLPGIDELMISGELKKSTWLEISKRWLQ